jgi:hypothetical protein
VESKVPYEPTCRRKQNPAGTSTRGLSASPFSTTLGSYPEIIWRSSRSGLHWIKGIRSGNGVIIRAAW